MIQTNFGLGPNVGIIFGLILLLRLKFGLISKVEPNACCRLKNLCKLVLRPKFGLRTKSDIFYQFAYCITRILDTN